VLILLPPSETKRDGGEAGSCLDLTRLGFDSLTPQRTAAISALRSLSRGVAASTAALGLGKTQRFEIDRNRALLTSPVMPALDRYTGVLYDSLDAATLNPAALDFAHHHLAIHSALFGLVRAGDAIPAYRLSHDSRLPGLPLARHWKIAIAGVLAQCGVAQHGGLILDLRSEAYAALGPAPLGAGSYYVRVVSESATGKRSALSHFNKSAKGSFARALLSAGIDHPSLDSLLEWGAASGIRLEPGVGNELALVTG
jgi:cytoplasmic iron level regulating protein YaaA (DUF328/UPF0246 family)